MNIRYFILTAFILLMSVSLSAQSDTALFCQVSRNTNITGMYVLGSWALVNLAGGAYGWSKYSNRQKYFYQMNFLWNTVNLSIACIGLYNNYQLDCSLLNPEEIMSRHMQTEKILLINSALDVGYIGTGFLLRYFSTQSARRGDLLKGYGNSLVLQGSFLLVFDLVLYGILRNQRIDFLNNLNLVMSPEMTGLQFILSI
ncbi:MAG: hypothetical protein JW723_15090 [Bacteroidales bacterium]|nr:hypothetical protein [Bacteroidales bacterium]